MNFCGLLRARCERPRGRDTAEKGDELPSPHGLAPQVEDHTLAYRRTGAGLCITAKWAADVGDGSKPEILTASRCFPLYPSKRTSGGRAGMSVQCQERSSAGVDSAPLPLVLKRFPFQTEGFHRASGCLQCVL